MHNLNDQLFLLLNATPLSPVWHIHLAILIAKYAIFVVPLGLILAWLWGPVQFRNTLFVAVSASILALLANMIISYFWFLPRPFIAGIGHTFMAHSPDNSFPSDHMTFMWAIGLSLLLREKLRLYGLLTLILAVLVGFARIYVGVHYPFDMIGAILIASSSVILLFYLHSFIDRHIFPPVERLYQKIFSAPIDLGWINE